MCYFAQNGNSQVGKPNENKNAQALSHKFCPIKLSKLLRNPLLMLLSLQQKSHTIVHMDSTIHTLKSNMQVWSCYNLGKFVKNKQRASQCSYC